MSFRHQAGRNKLSEKKSALAFFLHIKTGKTWTGEFFPTLKGVKVGGAFIDQAKVVGYKSLVEGGILNEVNVMWGKKLMKIISIYRSSSDNLEGSLRKNIDKQCGGDLDSKISEVIAHVSNDRTIIGGDFNLDTLSVARFMLKSGIRGSLCPLDEDSFFFFFF